jgi:hypothetical protein
MHARQDASGAARASRIAPESRSRLSPAAKRGGSRG